MHSYSGEPCVNICVGNLAFTTTEQDWRQLFELHGTVETARIMTDPRDRPRAAGFGFVEMPESHAVRNAIDALNGMQFAGRALTVQRSAAARTAPGTTPATLVDGHSLPPARHAAPPL